MGIFDKRQKMKTIPTDIRKIFTYNDLFNYLCDEVQLMKAKNDKILKSIKEKQSKALHPPE